MSQVTTAEQVTGMLVTTNDIFSDNMYVTAKTNNNNAHSNNTKKDNDNGGKTNKTSNAAVITTRLTNQISSFNSWMSGSEELSLSVINDET
jgi:hypothetical protein